MDANPEIGYCGGREGSLAARVWDGEGIRSYAVEICAKRSGVAESIYTYRDSATTVANATSAQNDSKNSILL
ncbi:hypothetical protein CCP3SC5AM1_370009 [Gammaproteobacteria bacterium]